MVQYFAEEIGLPEMQRLHQAYSSMNKVVAVASNAAPCVDAQQLIPSSETPWHTFYGRDPLDLEWLIAKQHAAIGGVPAIPSAIPRRIPPLSTSTPAVQPSPILDAGKGKGSARTSCTVDDIKDYAEQLAACSEHDEVGLVVALS